MALGQSGPSGGATAASALSALTGAVARTSDMRFRDAISVKEFGAKGDGVVIAGACTISSGLAALTVAGATFVASDVGKTIIVPGAGAAAANLVTTIFAWTSATQVTLGTTAGTTLSAVSKSVLYGTDDSAAFTAAMLATSFLFVPEGVYLVGSTLSPPVPNGSTIIPWRGFLLQGAACAQSDPRSTSYRGGGSSLVWIGADGGTLFQSDRTLGLGFKDITLVGRATVGSGNRAGKLIHIIKNTPPDYGSGSGFIDNVIFYDAVVGVQFGVTSADTNCDTFAFPRVFFQNCDTCVLVKNSQGLIYTFGVLNMGSCIAGLVFEQGGSCSVQHWNANICGTGGGSLSWLLYVGAGGNNAYDFTIGALRYEQNCQQIVKVLGKSSVVISNISEAQANQSVRMFDVRQGQLQILGGRLISHSSSAPTFHLEHDSGFDPRLLLRGVEMDVSPWLPTEWFDVEASTTPSILVEYCTAQAKRLPRHNTRFENGQVTVYATSVGSQLRNMTLDGGSVTSRGTIPIIPVGVYEMMLSVTARDTTTGDIYFATTRVLRIKRLVDNTTTLISSTTIGTDVATATLGVIVSAGTGEQALLVQPTGVGGHTLEWVAAITPLVMQFGAVA